MEATTTGMAWDPVAGEAVLLCVDCGHPQGALSWEWPEVVQTRDRYGFGSDAPTPEAGSMIECELFEAAMDWLRGRMGPLCRARVPYSRCHTGCTHAGQIRLRTFAEVDRAGEWERWGEDRELPAKEETYDFAVVEASWRPVEARVVEGVEAMLCLRCFVKREREAAGAR